MGMGVATTQSRRRSAIDSSRVSTLRNRVTGIVCPLATRWGRVFRRSSWVRVWLINESEAPKSSKAEIACPVTMAGHSGAGLILKFILLNKKILK